MRKLKTLWRSALSPRVWEELETWIGVMLFLGAAALLFVTLKAQAAYASSLVAVEATQLERTMAAGAVSFADQRPGAA
jgi:hypothetical protein